MRQTNPIWPRRRRPPEEIVQNEAKLGMTGVYGQRPLSCGSWLGRRVTAPNEPNSGPGAPRLRIADWGLRIGRGRPQASAGKQMRETNPISPGRRVNAQNKANFGHRREKSGGDAQPTKRGNAQNKANLATGEFALNNVVKGSYGRFACDAPLRNKANFGWPGDPSIADW
jgi:hypothetical protein